MPGNVVSYGYRPPKPKPLTSLARAASQGAATASSYTDPYGLGGAGASSGLSGNAVLGGGYRKVTPAYAASQAPVSQAPTIGQAAQAQAQAQAQQPTLPTYDLNTDPALQQVQALVGQSDDQARAAALKQKQQLLLDYGDQSLAQAILGAGDPTAAAAGASPTSTLASLKQQRDRGLADFTDQLNKANLFYSGARVKGEQQAGEDYQNALAQAASAVNASLGSIDSQLTSALGQNAMARAQAMQDAYNRALSAALSAPPSTGPTDPWANSTQPTPTDTQPAPVTRVYTPLPEYWFGRLMGQ